MARPNSNRPDRKPSTGPSALRDATGGSRRPSRSASSRSASAARTSSGATASATTERDTKTLPRHDQVPTRRGLAHRLYTGETSYDFMKNRRKWYAISGVILLVCLLSLAFRGLNLGIEFQGGTVFTVPVAVTESTTNDLGRVVESTGVGQLDGTSVVTIGNNSARVQTRSLSTEEVAKIRTALAEHVGSSEEQVAYSTVGASWGQQITEKGLQALVVFLVLVGLMIWAYFRDWKMSVAALVALLHDLVLTVGVYSILGFTVSPASLIGVLTILGYSLYDTVVVFDKVRENVKDITRQKFTYAEQANLAVNQVLVRSINTTVIGVLPVGAILIAATFFMGPGPLEDLGLALFVGMIAGAYSSVFIAAPLLAQMRESEPELKAHRARLGKRTARHARGSAESAIEAAEAGAAEQAVRESRAGGPEVIVNEVGETPWELAGVDAEDVADDDHPQTGDEADGGSTAAPRRERRNQSRKSRRS